MLKGSVNSVDAPCDLEGNVIRWHNLDIKFVHITMRILIKKMILNSYALGVLQWCH